MTSKPEGQLAVSEPYMVVSMLIPRRENNASEAQPGSVISEVITAHHVLQLQQSSLHSVSTEQGWLKWRPPCSKHGASRMKSFKAPTLPRLEQGPMPQSLSLGGWTDPLNIWR